MTVHRNEQHPTDADYQRVIAYLQEHASGSKNAKTRRQIEPLLYVRTELAERLIRKIGALANERGVPVAAGNDGYFIAQSFEEFEPMLKRMRHQRDAMHERVQNVERLRFKLFGDKLQPSFSAILELGSHE